MIRQKQQKNVQKCIIIFIARDGAVYWLQVTSEHSSSILVAIIMGRMHAPGFVN